MKAFLIVFLAVILNMAPVYADITEIQKMEEILPSIESANTLVLFDMDDTLTDSTISLGTGAWRKYIRQKIPEYENQYGNRWDGMDLHDLLTLYVANKVAVKPVESALPQLIADLQNKGIPVFVFTARGKSKWYSTDVDGIDLLTEQQLSEAGFDFNLTQVPQELHSIDTAFYKAGVIYSSPLKKGAFFKDLLARTNYRPSKVIFVDDKLDQVESMEKAANEMGIPFIGFWYTRADREHRSFDPILATIQLKQLLEQEKIIDDNQALIIRNEIEAIHPDTFFKDFLDQFCLPQAAIPR